MEKTHKEFEIALNQFVEKAKNDKSIVAVILLGSLAHDTVWEKSDIDITVIVKEQKLKVGSIALTENNISIMVDIFTVNSFRSYIESFREGSFHHSLYYYGKLIYSKDSSISELIDTLKHIGDRDIELSLMVCANNLYESLTKAEKALVHKKDIIYCQYYLVSMVCGELSKFELIAHKVLLKRESVLIARNSNPKLINRYYIDMMKELHDADSLLESINYCKEYLYSYKDIIAAPVLRAFEENDYIKTVNELAVYNGSNTHVFSGLCNFLCECGVLRKTVSPVRITAKSPLSFEQTALIKNNKQSGN